LTRRNCVHCVHVHIRSFDLSSKKYFMKIFMYVYFFVVFRKTLEGRIDGEAPGWYLYYFCGLLGVLEEFKLEETAGSLEICVDGRVPRCAGLSSSSALVCAATLATLSANNVKFVQNILICQRKHIIIIITCST